MNAPYCGLMSYIFQMGASAHTPLKTLLNVKFVLFVKEQTIDKGYLKSHFCSLFTCPTKIGDTHTQFLHPKTLKKTLSHALTHRLTEGCK